MKSTDREERERRRNHHHGSHSLSSSTQTNPSCFYKLMLFPNIHSNKLRIPEVFSRSLSDELSGIAILTVPTGESWEVALVKEDDNLWFREGWREFVEYFSIGFAYFLMFFYEGNSKFEVHIFSPTACEISYPCNAREIPPEGKPFPLDDDDDDVDVVSFRASNASNDSDVEIITLDSEDDEPSLLGHDEPMRKDDDVSSDGFVASLLSSDDDMDRDPDEGSMHENQRTQSADDENQSEGLMEALGSIGISMPKNPFFVTLIKKYHIFNGCFVRVPIEFAREYLMCDTRKHMKVEASNGKQWKVRCVRTRVSFNLGSGWILFARENRLKVGDICVFELIKPQNQVFKVHIGNKSQLNNEEKWRELLKHRA